ncbi:MAG TPA: NAD(P)-binding domain-containing protein [Pseudonocardiaceae bacterium]|nr:NAD(P)-binding domain-containing protein [Pseudonocardiaceae bacterium]
MTTVTVLGLGPMGQALTRAFVAAGHSVTAWSRTAATPTPAGVTRAGTAAEAIAAGELTVVCIRGEAAVAATLDPLDLAGRTLVNLTSGTPAQARARAAKAVDVDYLAGAIMTPAPTVGTSAALVLYSGPEAMYEKWSEVLAAIGGTASYLGTDPGRASAYDIALLDLFWNSVNGIVHGLALARAEGISGAELAPYGQGLVGLLPNMLTRFGEQLDAGEFPGAVSTIASAEVSLEHIAETSAEHGIDASALVGGLRLVQRAIKDGHGADGLARLADTLGRV